tara:strand:+ start:267 stop:443 length:177 start_codon:yes stop_codon:yes gene_type:complete
MLSYIRPIDVAKLIAQKISEQAMHSLKNEQIGEIMFGYNNHLSQCNFLISFFDENFGY